MYAINGSSSSSSSSSSSRRHNHQSATKVVMIILGICLVGYIVGPPLYWQISDLLSSTSDPSYCPHCSCDCSSQPLLSLPEGWDNSSFLDCMKHDPEVNKVTEKSFIELLSEELKLHEFEALKLQQRRDVALLEAKKMASQYSKEADKCSQGMDTCEAAREKAEATLESQRSLSAIWELRARQRGWKDGAANQ